MFDNTQRTLWLEEQLWPALRKQFTALQRLPAEVLITVGYPSSGARGRSEKLKPAEINTQWVGNPNEKAFIAIHPIYFDKPENAAKALVFAGLKQVDGARWGATRAGFVKNNDGSITADAGAQARIDAAIAECGELPAGFGVAFAVRVVERARLRKYVCSVKTCHAQAGYTGTKGTGEAHSVHRVASDDDEFVCAVCGNAYVRA